MAQGRRGHPGIHMALVADLAAEKCPWCRVVRVEFREFQDKAQVPAGAVEIAGLLIDHSISKAKHQIVGHEAYKLHSIIHLQFWKVH